MAEAAELGDRLTMENKGGKHDLSDREVAVPLMEKKDTPNKEPIGGGSWRRDGSVLYFGHVNRNPRSTGEPKALRHVHLVFQQTHIEGWLYWGGGPR